jgi:hypothetical protein
MKIQNILPRITTLCLSLVIGVMAWAPASRAAVFGPYTVDNNTLHLWHLDETTGIPYITNNGTSSAQFGSVTNGVFFDAVTGNPQTSPIDLTNTPGLVSQPISAGFPPSNFAQPGAPAWVGTNGDTIVSFGYADQTTNFSCALPSYSWPSPLSAAAAYTCPTNLSDYINTNTGAFTFEALIEPLVNPLTAGKNMEIFCGDSGFAQRAWQFRITAAGKLEFNLNLNVSAAGVFHDVVVSLPSTGSNAVAAGNWYHVAVTYTGDTPTNGDTPKRLKLYWTYLDMARTNADVLYTTNLTYGFTNTVLAVPAIGGSGRGSVINNVGNSEGFIGKIDEVRVSSVCRKSTEMIFDTNTAVVPVNIGITPSQTNQLVAYGQTLQITASEGGSLPITNQWYQNGIALPGQTNAVLIISNVTFVVNGNYQLLATNAGGAVSSGVCSMNVGAAFNNLFNSGVDANGNSVYATAPGSVDQHYLLVQSADTTTVNSNAIVWGGVPNGGAQSTAVSSWIGPRNGNGAPNGTYVYQTTFQIDNADVTSSVLSGSLLAGGASANVVQAFLNGVETDITLAPNTVSTTAPFVITNGLQAGSNTLVFTLNDSSGNFPGILQVTMTGIGNALPAGLPTFNYQPPASQTVPYGAPVVLPVVALGQPPLTYQWLSNGVPVNPASIASATNQYLTFIATNLSPLELVGTNFTANYQVVASNGSGSVTSSVTALTITVPPLTLASAGMPIWNSTNNETNIVVTFSAPVDPTTAATVGNYSLDNGASVLGATLGDAPNKVVLTTSVLNPANTYQLTVQNVNSAFGVGMSPSPASITVGSYPANVALWLKADSGVTTDGSGNVQQWNDLSGNENNFYLASAIPPLLVTNQLNGGPVIRFNGSNDTQMFAYDSPSLEITNNLSIFAVVNFATLVGGTNGMIIGKDSGNQAAPYDYYTSASGVKFLLGNGTTSGAVTSPNTPSTGVPHLLVVSTQGNNVLQWLDGLPNGSGTLSGAVADTAQPVFIGTRANGAIHLSGDLAELIVTGSPLSTNDVVSLDNYLAAEYALPLGPTVNTNPTNLVFAATGGQLTLAWPADHTGWTLQAQTNNLSTGLGTNWVDVANSTLTNNIIIPINPANSSVFYQLIYRGH